MSLLIALQVESGQLILHFLQSKTTSSMTTGTSWVGVESILMRQIMPPLWEMKFTTTQGMVFTFNRPIGYT